MALMDEIREKLKELPELQAVYYGAIPAKHSLRSYNYAVYSKRRQTKKNGSCAGRWMIFIVMENYIPEDYMLGTVVPKLQEIKGLKMDPETDIEYDQEKIPQTSTILEAGSVMMIRAERAC